MVGGTTSKLTHTPTHTHTHTYIHTLAVTNHTPITSTDYHSERLSVESDTPSTSRDICAFFCSTEEAVSRPMGTTVRTVIPTNSQNTMEFTDNTWDSDWLYLLTYYLVPVVLFRPSVFSFIFYSMSFLFSNSL